MSKHETSFIKFLVLLFCLGLIQLSQSGCSKKLESDFNQRQFAGSLKTNSILGGVKVFETEQLARKVFYLSIRSTLIKTPMGFVGRQKSFCSAIAVNPSVILTAAHCVDGLKSEELNIIEGVSPWLSPLNPELWHSVEKIVVNPNYQNLNPEFDLAMLKLSTPLPSDSALRIYDSDFSLANLILAGFGFRSNEDAGELFYSTQFLKNYNLDSPTFVFEKNQMSGVCIGDSGGPALWFDDRTESFSAVGLLAGSVESQKMTAYLQDTPLNYDFCSENAVYNNLRYPLTRRWIEQTMNQLLLSN